MGEKRIILADCDAAARKNLKIKLARYDFLVVGEAGDGITALKLARERQPDLLVTDIHLNGLPGLEVAEIARQDRLVPVLMTAPACEQEVLERAASCGVYAILHKPVETAALVAAAGLALSIHREIVVLEEKVRDLENKLETRKVVEKAKGLLMQARGLSEAEAHKALQRRSMKERKSMRAVAEAIILAHDLMT